MKQKVKWNEIGKKVENKQGRAPQSEPCSENAVQCLKGAGKKGIVSFAVVFTESSNFLSMKEMQKKVSAVSEELELAAELLAPRKELSAIMLGNRESRVLNGWRRELVGDQLLDLL